jgi:predicted transcriptional regulator
MVKASVLSVRIAQRTSAKLDRLAKLGGRSKSWYVNRLLEDYLDREIKNVELILEGMRDIEEGRSISHEDVVASLRERVKARRKRAA